MARECASPWDMGKGKGRGKGGGYKGGKGIKGPPGLGGKGGYKGGGEQGFKGAGYKGKGKGGYQGTCFDCGQVGHKRGEAACWYHQQAPAPMVIGAVTGAAENPMEFGGGSMWELAQVEVTRSDEGKSGDRWLDPPDEQP